MKRLCLWAALSALITFLPSLPANAGSLAPALQTLAQGDQADVIVILRDQLDDVPVARGLRAARSASVAAAQGSVIAHLRGMRAQKIGQFRLINAITARISRDQAVELAANPLVQAVVPDAVIRAPRWSRMSRAYLPAARSSVSDLCDTLEPEALQLTNTAFTVTSVPQAQTMLDGHGRPVTGQGVKVAFIADGIDPNNPGFIRPDGSKVFIDYQDFSGDPVGTPTGGAEAFGDASSIAAQDMPRGKPLTFDITPQSLLGRLPSPCRIRIRGVAPGASLVGLKVYSSLGYTNESTFIHAIEYAVLDADVDVLNESFAGNSYPDNHNSPVALATAWAVRSGVTVVVSTGDAGSGTIGDPATVPAVIAVGASTSFRAAAQIGGLGIEPLASTGYISNNISSFSSGGFAQRTARTVDLVAPGDVGWALCSKNVSLFAACRDFNGNPASFQLFGGTSEAAPFTSGAAALVIQAYRSAHDDADPAPGIVKKILMSTATDLGAPSSEQGAGLLNTLAAVQGALAIADEHGTLPRRGTSVLLQPTSAAIVGEPRSNQLAEFTLTNTGNSSRHVVPHLQSLSHPFAGDHKRLNLQPGDTTIATVRRTFVVPAGAEHLDAAIAYQNNIDSIALVDLQLIDPRGRIAAYSAPQGLGNGYGHADVVSPLPGEWTAIISTPPVASEISYTGPVQFSWSAQKWDNFGSISPEELDLAPGATKYVSVRFRMPSNAGDVAAAIRFDSGESSGLRSSIPVSLRSLIAVDERGGNFSGQLIGGNGRPLAGPTQTFEFDVPRGAGNLDLTVTINDSAYALQGFLIDPQGLPLSVQPNLDPSGSTAEYGLRLLRREPQPGRWRFTLFQNYNSSGNQTSLPFEGHLSFEAARVTASGFPESANVKLAAGRSVDLSIRITNDGPTTLAYFADARRDVPTILNLKSHRCMLVPSCASYYIPPATSGVVFVAHSDRAIGMDVLPESGFLLGITNSPDIYGREIQVGTLIASLFAPEIPYGPWGQYPAFLPPFGPDGTPLGLDPIDTAAYILYQPFDTAVSSDRGNKWLDLMTGSTTYAPLLMAPGATGIIHIKITPDASEIGQTVSGNVYVETFNDAVLTGDEVTRIPYQYRVTP
jgi:hypothetical protein